jgi:glutamate--cysteine ligase regulatory subunit
MSSGQAVLRRPTFSKSNVELINSLHANFDSYKSPISEPEGPASKPGIPAWVKEDGDDIQIPMLQPTPLSEPRESYDITAKLFYLPGIPSSRRCKHTREAINLVLKELGVNSIDLLIVSYPGVSFDADDDGEEEASVDEEDSETSDESEGFEAQVKTWQVLETLHQQGTIAQLGLAEFSSARLEKFLPEVKVRPSVDQINVKDCCVVPKTLIMYAKEHNIELLTHNDCTDILPPGTTRELLGPGEKGAHILAARSDAGPEEPGLTGDIEPQWVIKYTAVVKDRGVIENKGYFAVAQLGSCIEDKTPVV